MKVAQVTTVHPGTENRITYKHAVALAEAGHDVHLIAPPPRADVPGITHHLIQPSKSRLGRVPTGATQVMKKLRDIGPDVVHIHDPELLPTALTFTRSHKAKLVYDAHENLVAQIESKAYLSRAAKPLARLAASTLTAAADRLADAIVIAEPELAPLFPKNPTVVAVQNYPWVSNLMGEPASTQVGDRPTIGYVGAISSDRGLEAMVEATQRSRHKPRLLLAGKLHPESLRDKLKTESVSYVGPISPAAVPDFIAQFDVGLCLLLPKPNYVDAKSTKIYEYMAAARPFVYSNFPRWVREHGSEYGTPVSPDDIESIVDAIDQLLDDGAGRERMGTRGRQRVRDDFSYEAQADALTRLYDSLLEGRPQQRLQGQNY